MRKILLLSLLFFLYSLLKPHVVTAQCTVDPQTYTMEKLCQDFDNDQYNQFKVRVAKSLLVNYPDVQNRLTLDLNDCNVLGYTIDDTSDPDDVIFTFPTNIRCTPLLTGAIQRDLQAIVKYNPPGMPTWQDICSVPINIIAAPASCHVIVLPISGIGDVNSDWLIQVDQIVPPIIGCKDEGYRVRYPDTTGKNTLVDNRYIHLRDNYYRNIGKIYAGSYTVDVADSGGRVMCSTNFNVAQLGSTPVPTPSATLTPSPAPPSPTYDPTQPTWTPIPPVPSLAPLCDQIDPQYSGKCWNCINTGGIWTAIGCLPTDWGRLISDKLAPLGVGIGAAISFLYFLYGVFLILTSGGNAEKIAEGKEIIISALSGLFLIIFSVFLLRVIGYDILKIPGFG